MKNSTKQVILNEARKLFNQYGYNGVSMKDIADAAGISKGNLTYHFRKKENIMEALVSPEKNKEMSVPENLKQLDETFSHIQEVVTQNSFYFLHHAQLSQLSPEIMHKQNLVYNESAARFKNAFANMQQAGLIRRELIEGEYDTVIDALHMGSIYWEAFNRIQESKTDYRKYAWNLMYSFLTEMGRKELESIQK